jgi:hypothetical protein
VEYVNEISWETEVWVAESESSSHMIHFSGAVTCSASCRKQSVEENGPGHLQFARTRAVRLPVQTFLPPIRFMPLDFTPLLLYTYSSAESPKNAW